MTPEEQRKRDERNLIRAYGRFAATEDGKLILANLQTVFDPASPVFGHGGSYDPIQAAHRDGARAVTIHIATMAAAADNLNPD